jgi:hypothetical protein
VVLLGLVQVTLETTMTMEDLYQEMKEVLKFFGLSFHQKELVTVKLVELNGMLYMSFSYNNRHTFIEVK